LSAVSAAANIVINEASLTLARDLQVLSGESIDFNAEMNAVVTIDLDDNTTTDITTGTVTVNLNADLDNANDGSGITVDNLGNDDASTMTVLVNVDQSDLLLTAATTIEVTMSGSGDVNLDPNGTFESLDASGLTGALTATADTNHTDITSGSGADTLTVTAAASVVDAGSNGDTVILGNVAYTGTLAGNDGTDTLQLTAAAGATTITSATVSGFEIIDLQGEQLNVDDAYIHGQSFNIIGDNGATNDDILVIQDIDTAVMDLSGLQQTLLDYTVFNATSANYTVAGTANNGVTATAAIDATALGSSVSTTFTGTDTDDIVVTGGGADVIVLGDGANEASTGAGNDTVTGGAGVDYVVSGTGNEVYSLGEGADYVNSGTGTASIDLGASDGDADIVEIDALDNDNLQTITSYEQGTDTLRIDEALVNGGTGNITDGLVTGEYQTAAAATTYTVGANQVAIEFNFEFDSEIDLNNSGAGASKADILSALGAADDETASSVTAATLTMTAAGDQAIGIFYQSSNAYIYEITSGADADITTADADDTVELVAILNGVDAGDLAFGDFVA